MKKQMNLFRPILIAGLVTLLVLMVPFVAMQFTEEVKWSTADFLIMGTLIFGTGLSYVVLSSIATDKMYKAAFALALLTLFVMMWANLAVGLIGSGPHAGNLLYVAVISVSVAGAILSRFRAAGMQLTMYITAIALALHTVIALLLKMHEYAGSSVTEIICINGFFAALFLISGSLFRFSGKNASAKPVV